jgi:hypothetical protein
MANKPKEKTIVRTNPFSGNQKTITKSKSVDAQGTVTKSRSVTEKGQDLSTKKVKAKQKFANGATRKVKSLSSSSTDIYRYGPKKQTSTTATKEKVVDKGLVNKLKGLAKPSQKTGYTRNLSGGYSYTANNLDYASAKKTVKRVNKNLKKG